MRIFNKLKKPEFIIQAGAMIDNVSPGLQVNTVIVVNDGKIKAVKPNTASQQEFAGIPAGLPVVSLPELTVMPALIDCHVHLGLDGKDFQAAVSRWSAIDAWLPQVKDSLQASLTHGLAVIRDGGDKSFVGLQARNLVNEGKLAGPRILACGQAIYKQGRYGSFLGPGITSVEEAYQLIERQCEQGADWIKVLVSGIVSFKEYNKVGGVQFSQAELDSIVAYAHSKGKQVMAHASSDEAVRQAADAGVDSVEHGYFVSTGSLETLAKRGIPWIPTVVPVANQVISPYLANHTPESCEVITKTYELQLQKIAEARSIGVKLGIGTDSGAAGVPHGFGYQRELELFQAAGLTAAEVITAATATNAQICGLEQELGSIGPGKKACLIGVRGNPLENLQDLTRIEFVLN